MLHRSNEQGNKCFFAGIVILDTKPVQEACFLNLKLGFSWGKIGRFGKSLILLAWCRSDCPPRGIYAGLRTRVATGDADCSGDHPLLGCRAARSLRKPIAVRSPSASALHCAPPV